MNLEDCRKKSFLTPFSFSQALIFAVLIADAPRQRGLFPCRARERTGSYKCIRKREAAGTKSGIQPGGGGSVPRPRQASFLGETLNSVDVSVAVHSVQEFPFAGAPFCRNHCTPSPPRHSACSLCSLLVPSQTGPEPPAPLFCTSGCAWGALCSPGQRSTDQDAGPVPGRSGSISPAASSPSPDALRPLYKPPLQRVG